MILLSHGTPEFWRLYGALPAAVKALARKNYQLWSANAFHPSLHFKQIGKPNWSVRVGDHYRAVGKFSGSLFLWSGSARTRNTISGFEKIDPVGAEFSLSSCRACTRKSESAKLG